MIGQPYIENLTLTSIDIETSKHKAVVIRKSIEEKAFTEDTKTPLRVTGSIGLSIHQDHPDYKPVIEAAGAALYKVKNSGKNRWVFPSI